eukprot:CAMPEP_0204253616 /NCGR_PEP_ID=MMETSP0468-20130131/1987_1 /ASSEMBLY_ACC=CAM_ASM_000383 /TAXON_ID=2969 /ORGANISM="Oxyrrhis marina" /LENGTH=33 /DNA_ID= /DNA_START= /DNA_END= /DNA_ORIENTATION=
MNLQPTDGMYSAPAVAVDDVRVDAADHGTHLES